MVSISKALSRATGKGRDAVRLSRYGERGRDRLRILLLTAAMPVVRRFGRGPRVFLRVRVDGEVVRWVADNYADIAVLEEVFGKEVYDLGKFPAPATILDLGSHVGASVLFFARRHPQATIIAVEADPTNFAKLSYNVGHLRRVSLVKAAAAAHTGTLTLYSSGSVDSWKSSTRRFTAWQRPIEVRAVRIDDLLAESGAGEPIVVKIDIEGAEYEVLESFDRLERVAGLVGEVHPGLMSATVDEFRQVLQEFDVELPDAVMHDTVFRAVGHSAALPAR
jgi:FkbM family methyltransferase